MNWLVWRQHRKQFLVIGVFLALYAAVIIPTGLHFWHTYQQTVSNCALNPATPSCSDIADNLFQSSTDQLLFHLVPLTVVLIPLVLGIFWGAPLLSKEYTEGTNSLAWTQSISRRKWLTIKLLWVLGATILFAGAFAALNTWWSKTSNTINYNRFDSGIFFDSQGLVPATYALFAVSYGIMFGAWFRKVMLAVGLTLGLFIAVVLIVVPNFARPVYMSPITVTTPMGPGALQAKIPKDAWITSRNIVDKNGRTFNSFNLANMPEQCQQIIQQSQVTTGGHGIRIKAGPSPSGGDPIDTCLNNAGYHQIGTYQPSYRYWDFQRIEAALYIALSILPIGATYWLVVKRDA